MLVYITWCKYVIHLWGSLHLKVLGCKHSMGSVLDHFLIQCLCHSGAEQKIHCTRTFWYSHNLVTFSHSVLDCTIQNTSITWKLLGRYLHYTLSNPLSLSELNSCLLFCFPSSDLLAVPSSGSHLSRAKWGTEWEPHGDNLVEAWEIQNFPNGSRLVRWVWMERWQQDRKDVPVWEEQKSTGEGNTVASTAILACES